MPQQKSPTSLRFTCLCAIAKNMDYWCQDYIDNFGGMKVLYVVSPFHTLPQQLIVDLINLLKEMRWLKRLHLSLLLHLQTEHLDLSPGLSKDAHLLDGLTNLISIRCPRLKVLNLSHCLKIPHKALLALPEALPNIQALYLNSTNATDAVLSAIGGHCHDLRKLDVSYCSRVSDAGISALCVDLQAENGCNGCFRLQSLSVDETSVTEVGALCAIKMLPLLEHFNCNLVCAAFYLHFKNCKEANLDALDKYKLKDFWFKVDPMMGLKYIDISEQVTEVCPEVTKLTVEVEDPLFCSLLMTNFKNLCELNIVCDDMNPMLFDEFAYVLQHMGHGLKSLSIQSVLKLDMFMIGESCPNLKELTVCNFINCRANNSTDKPCSDSHFSYLESLKIICCHDHSGVSYSHLLHILSCSRKLQNLCLILCQEVTDELIDRVLNVNSFANLESFTLDHCNNVNVESMVSFMKLQNPLNYLRMTSCKAITNANYQLLLKMAEDENFDIEIEWV